MLLWTDFVQTSCNSVSLSSFNSRILCLYMHYYNVNHSLQQQLSAWELCTILIVLQLLIAYKHSLSCLVSKW